MTRGHTIQISVTLSAEVEEELRRQAEAETRSRSQLAAVIITRGLSQRPREAVENEAAA